MSKNILAEKLEGEVKSFVASLEKVKSGNSHMGTMGQKTEKEWIKLFDNYLPKRYAISSGIIIDHKGDTSHEIDLIIYDPYYTPVMSFDEDKEDERKINYVTIEAVYAVFEIKQKISNVNLIYAEEKSQSVLLLKRTNKPIPTIYKDKIYKDSRDFKIICGILAKESEWKKGLALSVIKKYKSIDFVITAQNGFYDASQPNKICNSNFSLFRALFRLFARLSAMGNPLGIDCEEYLKTLG